MKTKFRLILAVSREVVRCKKARSKPICLGFRTFFGLHEFQSCHFVFGIALPIVPMHEDVAEFMGYDEAGFRFAQIRVAPNFAMNMQCERGERDVGYWIMVMLEDIKMKLSQFSECFADKTPDQFHDVESEAVCDTKSFADIQR